MLRPKSINWVFIGYWCYQWQMQFSNIYNKSVINEVEHHDRYQLPQISQTTNQAIENSFEKFARVSDVQEVRIFSFIFCSVK